MTVLKNVELFWGKLDPKNPVSPFGEPVWEQQIRTRNKDQAKEWKEANLNVKTNEDDEGIYYSVNLKKRAVFGKTGEPTKPVPVVDGQLMPLDPTTVGNGSVGNVQLVQKPYDVGGRKGISTELKAIQVVKLVEYQGSANGGLAFEAIGETETVAPVAPSGNSAAADDLWD